ncbi:DUF29 family protein [uncultured Enterovirga sp.]|uniref:DUF29 family protein n=1 Tax=uncultured Enterovirga sp. TaxID=2026352 RepID=UPI0035CA3D8E
MTSLYATDLVLWSEQQAAALRQLAGTHVEVDWERIAKRLDDAGHRALARVEAALRAMLAQAIAGYCDPGSLSRRERAERVLFAKSAIDGEVGPTLRRRLDLDRLWQEGFDLAVADLGQELKARKALGLIVDPDATGIQVPPGIPRACPFTLDELLAADFTYDRAVEQLYIRLTTWRPKAAREA